MSPRAQGGVTVGDAGRRRGMIRRALAKLASSDEELEDEHLQSNVTQTGSTPISSCADRQLVHLYGDITAVSQSLQGGKPALQAELRDGSGTVTLIWLGRQEIPGIESGRQVSVSGRVSCRSDRGRRVMFNPRYELRCPPRT
jgi:RecJ-like exonuclease